MKIVCWLFGIIFWLQTSAYAIAPINSEIIKQAYDYGEKHVNDSFSDFLKPWLAYEEKASKLNETTDRAYLYTTYLLLANDAREKKASGKLIVPSDSERIITDYSGMLNFSVTLFDKDAAFIHNAVAVLKQGSKTIKAYQSITPPEAEKCTWLSETLYTAQCYFYFSDHEIDAAKPVMLIISTANKQERKFYFDLAKIK